MGNYLRAGALSDNWSDPATVSMAKEMEDALASLIPPPVNDNPDARRKLFIAIATGVINHLQQNAQAITVDVPLPTGTVTLPVKINVKP